ncbi:hypothetical protein GJA_1536 [Janthinobacterium agaricidamnosum NBRC 102515 = DSM 9628]|uniref:Uncharacterized protein n=1 Tax=Janthinobacterium agaricidamnosum NBRC 102515 = DSM 9628 TaxID=1349767 RepID=W0V4A2_9BURK|nr:hypothetical protein GJA_1536 [Janthinobacterium agaricidamnosum NBRC 102515 = DSM 9628]
MLNRLSMIDPYPPDYIVVLTPLFAVIYSYQRRLRTGCVGMHAPGCFFIVNLQRCILKNK